MSAIASVVGLLVQWASQGQHWAHMARDLLQVRLSYRPLSLIVMCVSPRHGPRMPDSPPTTDACVPLWPFSLRQGSGALVGCLNETGPAYRWVEASVPTIVGGRTAGLYLLDPSTGDLQHVSRNGTQLLRIRHTDTSPTKGVRSKGVDLRASGGEQDAAMCLAARAVQGGRLVAMLRTPQGTQARVGFNARCVCCGLGLAHVASTGDQLLMD